MSASVGGSLAKGVSSVAAAFEFAEELEIAVMIAPAGMEPAHLGDGLRDLRIDGIHGHAECEGEVIKIHTARRHAPGFPVLHGGYVGIRLLRQHLLTPAEGVPEPVDGHSDLA